MTYQVKFYTLVIAGHIFFYPPRTPSLQHVRIKHPLLGRWLMNKQLLKDLVAEVSPTNGPWLELTQLLHNCDEAFNNSAASLHQVGMPANCIACISHMLCDERTVACLIPLSVPVQSQERPAMLDQQKETGKSLSDSVYADIFSHYKEWIKEYANPFVYGPFAEDVGVFKPHMATFKDVNTIKGYIKMVVGYSHNQWRQRQTKSKHSTYDLHKCPCAVAAEIPRTHYIVTHAASGAGTR
jgi:hypothetical protein